MRQYKEVFETPLHAVNTDNAAEGHFKVEL